MSSRRARSWAPALAAGLALAGPSPCTADVYVLVDGDRITGRTLSDGRKTYDVQTAFGKLSIPRGRVERILRENGRVEVVNPSGIPVDGARLLTLVVTGNTFWFAWQDRRDLRPETTLQFQVRLDDEPVASYLDAGLDPGEIAHSLVNAFSFLPQETTWIPGAGSRVLTPEVQPGRIVLRIELPAEKAGRHRLHLAYQINGGSEEDPVWHEVATTSADVEIRTESPTFVRVRQERGRMEFSGLLKKRMKNIETFQMDARSE